MYPVYPDAEIIAEGMGAVAGILGIVLGGYLLAMGLSVAMYILQALGLYTIAQRRGLKNPWLAWLPLTNMWILGSISDQYQYVSQGLVRNRRKVLLGLGIAVLVLGLVFFCMYMGGIFHLMMQLPELEAMTEEQILQGMLAGLGSSMIVAAVMWVLGVISMVFQFVCLYNLYASCSPQYKVLFLVLSILINVSSPFIIFACRKKDLGMPPRKDSLPEAFDD